jgi:putative flippase GtrA
MAITTSLITLVKLVLRFLVSGGIATAIHWATLWGLIILQVEAVLASSIGAFVGVIANYFLQYFFNFKTKRRHKKALLGYMPVMPVMPVMLVSWLLNLVLFYCLYSWLLPDPLMAQVVTTGIVMVVNFFFYKKLLFRSKLIF